MGGHHHHHHHHPVEATSSDARYREVRKVTLVGSVLDLSLAVVKLIVGYIAQSQALIADGIHSLSDLATDAMVIIAAKHGSRDADEEHPYGHARIETVATVALGVALIVVAIGIAWDAVSRLFHPEALWKPGAMALWVAFISVISKEWIYHYTMRVARRLRSEMLKANAWHSRSDAISSIVVMVGVGGAMLGLDYLDAVAAVGVALMIAKIGWELAWSSIHELIDAGLEEEKVSAIRETITNVDGVRELHMLRTRRMGGEALVDVHIQVDPEVSVSEGHFISEKVRTEVVDAVDEVQDVLVHIDPEDDETVRPSINLPSRGELMGMLAQEWRTVPESDAIEKITLHYLEGKIMIEAFLPLTACRGEHEAKAVAESLSSAAERLDVVRSIQVYFT